MIILNVSFGIYAFMPQGWLFMLFVILIECLIMTLVLKHNWFDKKIYLASTISNLTSGIVGILASLKLNGGWWLVVWFPWVSNNEVNTSNSESLKWLYVLYGCAFVLSILIESLINWLFLRKQLATKPILLATIIVNIASYLIGTFILYSYSFR